MPKAASDWSALFPVGIDAAVTNELMQLYAGAPKQSHPCAKRAIMRCGCSRCFGTANCAVELTNCLPGDVAGTWAEADTCTRSCDDAERAASSLLGLSSTPRFELSMEMQDKKVGALWALLQVDCLRFGCCSAMLSN